jgi:hypothetical protein
VRPARCLALALAALPACDSLIGFDGEPPPLARVQAQITGDFAAVRVEDADAAALRVALVWGAQWLPEATCFAPAASPELAAAIEAGCRNPLAFTPARAAASVPAAPGEPLELPLLELPSAEIMVGDLTARVAYGSLVVFADRDGSGALELAQPARLPGPLHGPPQDDPPVSADRVYGASLVAMTEPDARLAFREGAFNAAAAFYPRSGCAPPPPGFSILEAGGFSLEAALEAAAAGELPPEDPSTCRARAPEDAVVSIALRPPAEVSEVACAQRIDDGSVRYREPPGELDLAAHPYACAPVPGTDLVELVVASGPGAPCKGLTHYTLRGCDDEAELACGAPEWNLVATPPAWWPCAGGAP